MTRGLMPVESLLKSLRARSRRRNGLRPSLYIYVCMFSSHGGEINGGPWRLYLVK